MAERYAVHRYEKSLLKVEDQIFSEQQNKKRERHEDLMKKREEAIVTRRGENRKLRHLARMNYDKYQKEYRIERRKLVHNRRMAKINGGFYVEPQPKLIFVIRLTGINKLAPKPRKILHLFRLRQIHNGTFLKVNKPILNMLKYVQPYVTYGYPTLTTVRKLIYKRGFGRIKKNKNIRGVGQRIPLDDNRKIHAELGQYGISCMEDLIHEIYTVGPHFKEANKFLWTFKLKCPRGGWLAKRHGFNEPRGGDWGNREEFINELINRMY